MAQDAHKRAARVMDAETEARLARIINSDLEQLREKAQVQGILAYGLKPVRRERLNERFLQNTLRGVEFANKKADEDVMWASRRQQHDAEDRHPKRPRQHWSDTRNAIGPGAEACALKSAGHANEEPISDWVSGASAAPHEALPAKRRRGRGGRGLKSEDAGPFLPAQTNSWKEDDSTKPARMTVQGPERPAWLPASSPSPAASPRSSRDTKQQETGQQPHGLDTSQRSRSKHKHKHKHHKHKHKHKRLRQMPAT